LFENVSQKPSLSARNDGQQTPTQVKTERVTLTSLSPSLSRINPSFNVPVNAILAVALFNILFGLLYLGPSVAFNAYISSCTIFLNCSYAGPILILLIRGRKTITEQRPDFPLGRVGGYVANWVAVVYVGVTSAVCLDSVPKKRSDVWPANEMDNSSSCFRAPRSSIRLR
jgi:hypothetical protein